MLKPRFLTTARHLGLAAALAFGANAWAVPEAQFAPAFEAFSQARSGNGTAIDKSVASFTALLAAEPGNPVLLAYLGASTAMQSNTTWLPWKKMNYAEDGLAMLDKALALLSRIGHWRDGPQRALPWLRSSAIAWLGAQRSHYRPPMWRGRRAVSRLETALERHKYPTD